MVKRAVETTARKGSLGNLINGQSVGCVFSGNLIKATLCAGGKKLVYFFQTDEI